MTQTRPAMRQCPTRPGGEDPLIEHSITAAACQERQRKHYHKCYLCSLRNEAREEGRAAGARRAAIVRELGKS